MPPKNKSKRREWYECNSCGYVIAERDLESHSEYCSENQTSQTTPVKHGFIFDDILNGVVSLLKIDKDSPIPKSVRDRVVCIHPSAMQLCGLAIGKPCVVGDKLVLTTWPSTSGPVSAISVTEKIMLELGCKKGELIPVTKLFNPTSEASEVALSSSDWREFYGQSDFMFHVKSRLEGKYLSENGEVDVQYFGKLCHFTVSKISPSTHSVDNVEIHSKITTPSDLSESLASLEISDISLDTESSLNQSLSSIHSDLDTDGSPSFSTPNRRANSKFSQFHTPVAKTTFNTKNHSQIFYKIGRQTKVAITLLKSEVDKTSRHKSEVKKIFFKDIGGLEKQMDLIKEMLEMPLKNPKVFHSYGLSLPHGILLFGPSGTGKTLLAHALVNEIKIHTIHVTGPQVWSKFFGETENKLRNIFRKARELAPSLVIIDEIDALCPKRENSQTELEKRVVATLLTLMDGINSQDDEEKYVVVIGITSKPDVLDSALRRPGRFDREIELDVPKSTDRFKILNTLLTHVPNSLTETDLTDLAGVTHAFVGADLAALVKEAGLIRVKKQQDSHTESICVTKEDLKQALLLVKPSAMREVLLEVPQVFWSDVGGQDKLKLKLKQAIEWPLQHPECFIRLGVQPPRGLLMYGPPGCSKTLIAKALATESSLNFLAVKGPELFSKWVGESERAVREVFRKARSAAPSIIFFDEIDALAVERGGSSGGNSVADRVLAQLLTEIDGIEKLQDVTIVAATNRPDMIDKALLRPGRIDRILYVPLPTPETRAAIFNLKFKTMPIAPDVHIQDLVDRTEFYSGAEITAVCHEAALAALQDNIYGECILKKHFDEALAAVTPRTSPESVAFYEHYHTKSGLHSI